MPANQLLLTGVPAFVGEVLGPTRVKFFVDEKQSNRGNMVEVDLAKNTQAIAAAAWAQDAECDHQTHGGRTTIGPTFHRDAKHVGCVYLAERIFTRYPFLASWPPKPDERYQYQLVLRANGGEERYHGFKVRVVSAAVGSLAHVEFFAVGESAPSGVPQWIDLADRDVCDPQANGFTTITPASPVGTIGALFMSSRVIAADVPNHPKIPPYAGR